MIEPRQLGRVIADVRAKRRMSQKQLAELTGFTITYLSLLENGKRSVSLEALGKLAESLRVPAYCLTLLADERKRGDAGTPWGKLHDETRTAIWEAIEDEGGG